METQTETEKLEKLVAVFDGEIIDLNEKGKTTTIAIYLGKGLQDVKSMMVHKEALAS